MALPRLSLMGLSALLSLPQGTVPRALLVFPLFIALVTHPWIKSGRTATGASVQESEFIAIVYPAEDDHPVQWCCKITKYLFLLFYASNSIMNRTYVREAVYGLAK